MEIGSEKIQAAVQALRSMGALRILLFGSFLDSPTTARDIDIAVEGIPLDRLLDADVAVHDILRAPFDLVSREDNPAFFELIQQYGRVLYESR
jgi:predicted nucleotidyltransferase